MVWKHNNTIIKEGKSWSDGTYKHPYNWATAWSAEDKKKFGLTWEDDKDTSFDSRFYWSKDIERKLDDEDVKDADGNQLYEEDGKTKLITEGLKTQWIRQTKETANHMLSSTDWLVTRKSEKGTAIPDTIATFRDDVRTKCASIEAKINACSSLADFKKLFDTPVDSDGNATGESAAMYDFPEKI